MKINYGTVAVAMSGGIDSSVAASRLLAEGHSLIGVTMIQTDAHKHLAEEAGEVCAKLGISHHIIDLRKQFHKIVIEYFIAEYMRGRTPNPCVLCNVEIKWGQLFSAARSLGAHSLATGHYARIQYDDSMDRYLLRRGQDALKDQSYALWRLDQDQLAHTILPLGELTKLQVRKLAQESNLTSANKSESQEICFIPDDDYKAYLSEAAEQSGRAITPGKILDQKGKIVGEHKGYPFYTIGQRKGLGIAMGYPVYVTHIDPHQNIIVIGERKDLYARQVMAGQTNWISNIPEQNTRVHAHIRYNDAGAPATIQEITPQGVKIIFNEPRTAITPGQSLVLYNDDVVLGGGIIQKQF
jgi:tRNA-specific 2-thiouridylase